MNLHNLRDNYHKLIKFMEEDDYSQYQVDGVKREIKLILSNANAESWATYSDIYREYVQLGSYSSGYLINKLRYLRIIENFDLCEQYPNGQPLKHRIVERSKYLLQRGKYHQLNQHFKFVIDCYTGKEKERGKKDSTIYTASNGATMFFYELQQAGYDTLDEITEEAVLSVFVSSEGNLRRSFSYKNKISAVLKACIPQNPKIFNKILAFLPTLRKKRKNIQYLKPEEVALLKQTLANKDAPISFRDRAMGTLAMYTGLRRSDIGGLTMNAIDWVNDRICIKQQKNGVPLELPLTAIVGNAIYDYLQHERPSVESDYVFISNRRPYGRMNNHTINDISNKIMKAANVRQTPGDRRGFHIFRYRVATELLGNGVPQPVITKLLGHTSPDSLEPYLSADIKNLKKCALSVERFQMPKGVFCDA